MAYVPLINVTLARGWRMDYIHRLGWRYTTKLPTPSESLRFLINGFFLWIALGTFIALPAVIIVLFGWNGWLALWGDLVRLVSLSMDYFWSGRITTTEFFSTLWRMLKNEIIGTILAFLVENIWLVVYVPLYRIGMIRFALTGQLLRSHLAVRKNLRFLFNNLVEIILMYSFNVFNSVLVIVIDTVLAFTVIGSFLIPIVTFFMTYWNTGYEYGLLAQTMVEQEGMIFERDAKSYGHTTARQVHASQRIGISSKE